MRIEKRQGRYWLIIDGREWRMAQDFSHLDANSWLLMRMTRTIKGQMLLIDTNGFGYELVPNSDGAYFSYAAGIRQ